MRGRYHPKHSPDLPPEVACLLDLILDPTGRAEWQRRPHLAETSRGRYLVACDGPTMLVIGIPRWVRDPRYSPVFDYPAWEGAARTQPIGGPKHAPISIVASWLTGPGDLQVTGTGLASADGRTLVMAGPQHPKRAQVRADVLSDLITMSSMLSPAPSTVTFQLRSGPVTLRPDTARFGPLDHAGVVSVELLGTTNYTIQLVLAAVPVTF